MTYKGHLLHAADPNVAEHSDPVPLYTAPPVPVIKLPDAIPSMGQDSEYDTGHNDGWNECLAEIKRLNDLEE